MNKLNNESIKYFILMNSGYCQRSNRCVDDYITLSTALSIIVLLEIGASECAVVFARF